ncbi:MAG: hypothetical protein ACRAVC_23385 [Trichormus sp.]
MSNDSQTNERIIVLLTPTPLHPYTPTPQNQGFWYTPSKTYTCQAGGREDEELKSVNSHLRNS